MAHSLRPTPLTAKQHVGVLSGRAILGSLKLVARLRPSPPPPGVISVHRYGYDAAEALQYIPARTGAPRRAPVVFMHGGGWITGSKELYTRNLFFLADAGFPVFNVGYPTAPENPHPGILTSLLTALAWIRQEHPHVDGVHLIGDSAGGNLAMMLAILSANPSLLEPLRTGLTETPLACHSVVSLYGILDRLSWLEHGFPGAPLMLEAYAGQRAFREKVGPTLAITPMDLEFEEHPPAFLIAGSTDRLCPSTRILAKRLEEGAGVARSKIYEGEGHGFFSMDWRPAAVDCKAVLLDFFEEHDPGGEIPGWAAD